MRKKFLLLLLSSAFAIIYYGCGKEDPPDPCAGVTVSITATVVNATGTGANGSISATATGGSGFLYSLNGASAQSSGNFTGLSAGTYTISAKSSDGCIGSAQFTVASTNPCAGVNITLTSVTTAATPCASPGNGSITASASGSSGFTFSLNNGTFQNSGTFSNLAPGTYSVVAKDNAGCTSAASSISVAAAPQGQLFTSVKQIIVANCISCHGSSNTQGGMNFSVDCNIVSNSARIKARAVDAAGTASQMPPPPSPALSLADRQKITEWINAGGGYNN
jgi:mono/diheme cytochrome c family protein